MKIKSSRLIQYENMEDKIIKTYSVWKHAREKQIPQWKEQKYHMILYKVPIYFRATFYSL